MYFAPSNFVLAQIHFRLLHDIMADKLALSKQNTNKMRGINLKMDYIVSVFG